MSSSEKYRLEAYSAKYNDVYRLDILEEGYSAAIIYKNIGAGKLQFEKSEGDKIQLTSIVISINADTSFEYIGFFQYNNRRFPVKLYKNDTQIWSGYIVAESYSEPYINPPYAVEVVATDGLGMLANYKFNNSGMQTRLEAIIHCIDNLGLQLDYAFAVDLFEQDMDTDKAMFDQIYFNGNIFYNEDCETVLNQLLPFGTTITQQNNRWLIRRKFEDAQKTHLVYDYEGNYTGTLTGETLLQMGTVSDGGIWPHGSPLLTMDHAWKNATIVKNYGKTQSFLKNYNFSLGTIENWTNATNGDVSVKEIDSITFVQIEGYVAPGSNLSLQQGGNDVVNTISGGGNFFFEMKYDAIASSSATNLAPATGIFLTVRLMVRIVVPVTLDTWYLSTTDGWTTSETIIELEITSSAGLPNWKDLQIITDTIPVDGNLIVDLYRLEYTSGGSPRTRTNIQGAVFTNVKAYTSELIDYTDPENIEVDIRENAADSDNEIELKPVDLPNVVNSGLLFNNGNYLKDGYLYELSRFWKNNNGDVLLYETIIENQLIAYYGNPRQKLSGCNWRGANLSLNAIAQHLYNDSRLFVADFGTWNILDDTWAITWSEKPNSASGTGTPWILDDAIWGDEGEIWKDDSVWEDTDV